MGFKLHLLISTTILSFNFVKGDKSNQEKKCFYVLPQSNVEAPSETLLYFVNPNWQQQPSQNFVRNIQPKETLYQIQNTQPIQQFSNILPINQRLINSESIDKYYQPVQTTEQKPIFVTGGTEQLAGQQYFANLQPKEESNKKIIIQGPQQPRIIITSISDDSKQQQQQVFIQEQPKEALNLNDQKNDQPQRDQPKEALNLNEQKNHQRPQNVMILDQETENLVHLSSNQLETTEQDKIPTTDKKMVHNPQTTSNSSKFVDLHKVNIRDINNNQGAINNNKNSENDFANQVLENVSKELVNYFVNQNPGGLLNQNYMNNVEHVKQILNKNLPNLFIKYDEINKAVQKILSTMDANTLQNLIKNEWSQLNSSDKFKSWKSFFDYVDKYGIAGVSNNAIKKPEHVMPITPNQQFQYRGFTDNNAQSANGNSNLLSLISGQQFRNQPPNLQNVESFLRNFNNDQQTVSFIPPQQPDNFNPPQQPDNFNPPQQSGNFKFNSSPYSGNQNFNNPRTFENQNIKIPGVNNRQYGFSKFNPLLQNNNQNFNSPGVNSRQHGNKNLAVVPLDYYGHFGNPNFSSKSDNNNNQS